MFIHFTESLSHYLIYCKYRFTNSSQRVYLITWYAICIGLYTVHREFISLPHMLSEARITHGEHVFVQSGWNDENLLGPSIDVSCKMLFYLASEKLTKQKQELSMVAMFVNGSGQNEQSL
jgi:hypothetical protein